jgi:Ca-activated chloride channel homolog
MFRFYAPWFGLLLPLPFFLLRLFPISRKDVIPAELYFPAFERLKKAFPANQKMKRKRNIVFFFLLFTAWLGLILALMQPERVDHFKIEKNKGYDVLLGVDISASMQAVDFSTQQQIKSRLDATKEVVGDFINGRQGDRIGLVLFGQHAYLHVPLTLDTQSVKAMLQDAVPGMAGNATAIGDAIGIGVRTLRERPEGSRVFILLTDGEDNSSSIPPLEAAKLAKQYGIRIYTVGVGRNGPVPFPSQFGGYGMAEIPIDEELLKEIASITEGRYFLATDQQTLGSIYEQINQLEKTESNESVFLIREPLYAYPLGIALCALLLLVIYPLLKLHLMRGAPHGI